MRFLAILALSLFACVSSQAQMHMNHFSQLPAFESAYQPERVVTIPAGETVAMPSGDIDLLWIEGTCVAPRDADLDLRVSEIVVAPGGVLDIGTEGDPVLGEVTVTFADGGFLDDDVTEWGHGLLVFGDLRVCGKDKPVWSEGSGDGEPVTVPDQYLDVMAPLFIDANNTITFKSENPGGTRGHIIITDFANCFIKNASLIGLGRTKPEPLSETNLIGRYALHFHHSMGPSRIVKNVFCDGLDCNAKWGIVVHASSWVTIEGCVAQNFGGAGFVTEDGSEVGNRFTSNLALRNRFVTRKFPIDVQEGFTGAGFWFKSMVQFIDNNVSYGNSFGVQSAVTAPTQRGVPDPGQTTSVVQRKYQLTPGAPTKDGTVTVFQSTLSGKNNRFVANRFNGFDCWGSNCQTYTLSPPNYYSLYALPCQWENTTFAYNGREFGGNQVSHSFTDSCVLYTNCDFIGTNPKSGQCSESRIDYHRVVYFDGCQFANARIGAFTGRGAIFRNNIFDNEFGIFFDKVSAQNWPFGVTVEDNNTYTMTPMVFNSTSTLTIDDIPLHQVAMDQVYQNVHEFRKRIGQPDGDDPVDPNAEERARLQAEIAAVNEQIATLMILLEDLESQITALGGGN